MSVLPNPEADRPRPVAVLCGSVTRAVEALNAAEAWYRDRGYTVHKPVKDDTRTPEEHAARRCALIDGLDIDRDRIVACRAIGEKYGDQTSREVAYATRRGVTVHFYRYDEERAS